MKAGGRTEEQEAREDSVYRILSGAWLMMIEDLTWGGLSGPSPDASERRPANETGIRAMIRNAIAAFLSLFAVLASAMARKPK